ncbi:MAG: GntG family PLP-dependent aldolase [Gemmatimonadota bacterium]
MTSRAADLRSDTVTRPSSGMREAMATAEVDDDVLGKDPTVDRLERRVAELLGKDRSLFFPSGTQANQAALLLHTQPGTEAVCEAEAHIFHYEMADAALLAGVQLFRVPSQLGRIEPEAVEAAIRPGDRHHPLTSLICVENTHNMHGGVVLSLDRLAAIKQVADRHDLPVHLDGARLWNASAASGVPLAQYAACADTVMVCLSKGLGCPIGSLLAGPAHVIERAWAVRKRLGGGMRQVGILAAAGLYALDHNLGRLAEDHVRATRLAEACCDITGLSAAKPDSNIVMIEVAAPRTPERIAAALEKRGVSVLPAGPTRLRAITHLDVDDDGIELMIEALGDSLRAS